MSNGPRQRSAEEIAQAFREMGLGTEAEREYFNRLRRLSAVDDKVDKPVTIVTGTTTEGTGRRDDA